jgi:hypothetical protein
MNRTTLRTAFQHNEGLGVRNQFSHRFAGHSLARQQFCFTFGGQQEIGSFDEGRPCFAGFFLGHQFQTQVGIETDFSASSSSQIKRLMTGRQTILAEKQG